MRDQLRRSGVKGQKWYHRYHQSYSTKPTRSGKVGEEHGDAKSKESNNTVPDKSKEIKNNLETSYKQIKKRKD